MIFVIIQVFITNMIVKIIVIERRGKHLLTSVDSYLKKTSQELRMLSSVTINCQVTKIVMNSGSQLSVL